MKWILGDADGDEWTLDSRLSAFVLEFSIKKLPFSINTP